MTIECGDEQKNRSQKQVKPYWLYLLECEGGSFYAGIALDVDARFKAHLTSRRGAAYTRAHKPTRILARREYPCKGDALRAEIAVKRLPKAKKLAFFVVSGP